MSHHYYEQDFDSNNEQRLKYFDEQFLSLAGDSINQITNKSSFLKVLKEAFDEDPSLSAYYSGMNNTEKELFFNRTVIQDLIDRNRGVDLEEEFEIPKKVEQVKGITRVYFSARIKGKRVIAYQDFIKTKRGKQIVYRDNKGRFAQRL